MKKIFLLFIIITSIIEFGHSQNIDNISCITGKTMFATRYIDKWGLMYYTQDTQTGFIDTLAISQLGSNVRRCFCSDTLVTFFIEDPSGPMLRCFTLANKEWKFMNPLFLPPRFPMVGSLKVGKRYEKYKHELVAPDLVASILTVFTADDNQNQIPLEKYTVRFKIDLIKNKIIIQSKDLKNE
jgi:hypothetical protein